MACANPFTINYNNQNFSVPCGYCLNCRVDKRNWLEDCCRAAYATYPSSCFAVLTYDDIHINNKYRITSDGSLVATLSKKDGVNFLKRFRSHLDYYSYLYKKYPDLVKFKAEKVDFKYVMVGEYGEHHKSGLVDRPHLHLLMFGIDPMLFKQAVTECWQNGSVYIGPIQSGGIRYVLKYLDKQIKGSDAKSKYDDNSLERPFQSHSMNLGYDYFIDNIDEIAKNNWTYLTRNGKRRPLSSYLKKKFMADVNEDTSFIISNLKALHVKPDSISKDYPIYSLMTMNKLRHDNSLRRMHSLAEMSRRDGFPAVDYSIYKTGPTYPVGKLVNQISKIHADYDDIIPF